MAELTGLGRDARHRIPVDFVEVLDRTPGFSRGDPGKSIILHAPM